MIKLKKLGVYFLFLSLLLVGFISSESCIIDTRTNCENNGYGIVLGLSDETNAHAQIWNYTEQYNYALCCDFGGESHGCYEGGAKVLTLSDETNAHAESTTSGNYEFDICYDDLNCTLRETCDSEEIGIASLYASTNSHIGGVGDYSLDLCCVGMCGEGQSYIDGECIAEAIAFWSIDGVNSITTLNADQGDEIYLYLKNSNLDPGTEVEIQIIESDVLLNDDIKTISTTVDEDGTVMATWVLNEEEQTTLNENEDDGVFELFFEVTFDGGSEESNTLTLSIGDSEVCSIIDYCRDYESEDDCEADGCSVASVSVENNDDDAECGEAEYNSNTDCSEVQSCSCVWDESEDLCVPSLEYVIEECNGTELETPFSIGQCTYVESTEDDCSDGFLIYSWESTWVWNSQNSFDEDPENDNYIYDEDAGVYRYDPEDSFGVRKSEACQSGETMVECPAEVQLPFFGIYSLIVSLILIIVIHFVLVIKRK